MNCFWWHFDNFILPFAHSESPMRCSTSTLDILEVLFVIKKVQMYKKPIQNKEKSTRLCPLEKKFELWTVSHDLLTNFIGLFHILGALTDIPYHNWPSRSFVYLVKGQRFERKPPKVEELTSHCNGNFDYGQVNSSWPFWHFQQLFHI